MVPYTFPVIKLPLVALQNFADYLNPHEIYHFSRVSKRTKSLAKALSKKATRISFSQHSGVSIEFEENKKWFILPAVLNRPEIYVALNEESSAYAYFSEDPASEVLRLLERIIDLFKNSSVHLDFDTEHSTRHDLISYFNWFMENPSEVPYVSMTCSHAEGVQLFLENYRKPSKKLNLKLCYGNDKQLSLPDDFDTTLFEEVKINNCHPVNFNLYNIFSCSIIETYEDHLTNQGLNTFLKNWQSGLTNSHWKSVCIKKSEPIELDDVLKDITATYRDPRTVKRQINTTKESCWIFGGIDIQKHDGTSTATIQWKDYKVENEDSEVPNELIKEYKKNSGVILDEEDQLQENRLHANFQLWIKRMSQPEFSMYIW